MADTEGLAALTPPVVVFNRHAGMRPVLGYTLTASAGPLDVTHATPRALTVNAHFFSTPSTLTKHGGGFLVPREDAHRGTH